MAEMFRIKVIVQQFIDTEPINLFQNTKMFVGIDRLIKTLALLTNRTIDDIHELIEINKKGLRC